MYDKFFIRNKYFKHAGNTLTPGKRILKAIFTLPTTYKKTIPSLQLLGLSKAWLFTNTQYIELIKGYIVQVVKKIRVF